MRRARSQDDPDRAAYELGADWRRLVRAEREHAERVASQEASQETPDPPPREKAAVP